MELLVATTNQHKLSEIEEVLKNSIFSIKSLKDVGLSNHEVEETGSTFQENAKIKAQTYSEMTKMLILAEDSGLEVADLEGFPGVMSNRWHSGSDTEKNMALLEKLNGVQDRTARFITVACIASQNKEPIFFEGKVTGTIAATPLGSDGFGYDPIFIPDGYDKTFAQLGASIKNTISHRAKALNKVTSYLLSYDVSEN